MRRKSMFFAKSRIIALVSAVVVVLGLVQNASAQSDYVKTFDLPVKPTTDGAYAGVDPTGATVIFWHPHQGPRLTAITAAVDKFNAGNPWKITIKPVFKGDYPIVFQAMLAALQTKDVPQLTVAYQNEAGTYQNANALVDLNDFCNDKVYGFGKAATDDFFQGYLASDVNPQFKNQRLGLA